MLLLARLGSGSFSDWDEAVYAQMAKEMVRTGDWLTPHWGYEPFLHKPPLYIWAVAALFGAFWVDEYWARLPSALAGLALVFLTFVLARDAYGRVAGFLSALILLAGSGFLWFARFATLDIVFTCLAYLAIYAYLRAKHQPRWWQLVWVAGALAFLDKSAAVLIFVIPIALDVLLDRGARAGFRRRYFWQASLAGVGLIAPWHVVMYLQHGQRFVDEYVLVNILGRATSGLEGNVGDAFYYLRVLHAQFFPWVFVLPLALASGLRDALRSSAFARLLLAMIGLALAAYTAIPTKLPWYIVPIYPAAAMLVGLQFQCWLRGAGAVSAVWLVPIVTGALLIARPLEPLAVSRYGPPDTRLGFAAALMGSQPALRTATLVLVVALVVAAVSMGRSRLRRSLITAGVCALFVVAASTLPPVLLRGSGEVAVLARVAGQSQPDESSLLVVFPNDDFYPNALFYSNRPVTVAWSSSQVSSLSSGNTRVGLILTWDALPQLADCCAVTVIAESGRYVYGIVTRRG